MTRQPARVAARSGQDCQGHGALALVDAQRWWVAVSAREGIAARALQFAALTVARYREVRGAAWDAASIDPKDAPRAVREYLDTLDEAAFGAASEVQPKFTSHSDPASQ